MRILFWTQHFWPHIGSVEVHTLKVALALRGRGNDIAVITSHGNFGLPDEHVHEGIPIYRFPFLRALASRDLGFLVET